jgi:hypothetical protein
MDLWHARALAGIYYYSLHGFTAQGPSHLSLICVNLYLKTVKIKARQVRCQKKWFASRTNLTWTSWYLINHIWVVHFVTGFSSKLQVYFGLYIFWLVKLTKACRLFCIFPISAWLKRSEFHFLYFVSSLSLVIDYQRLKNQLLLMNRLFHIVNYKENKTAVVYHIYYWIHFWNRLIETNFMG